MGRVTARQPTLEDAYVAIVSASPGSTGDAKRASMWWNFAGSESHSRCSNPRPVKP